MSRNYYLEKELYCTKEAVIMGAARHHREEMSEEDLLQCCNFIEEKLAVQLLENFAVCYENEISAECFKLRQLLFDVNEKLMKVRLSKQTYNKCVER